MTTTKKPKSDTAAPAPAKKRIRLTPEVRRQQILDAALIEFSSLGFAAASISKIASRVGTSKANLYVHFANKDEIFETLVRDVLVPSEDSWQLPQAGQSFEEVIDAFVEERYTSLTPQRISIIRLLISESHRVPDLIHRWHEETLLPARTEQQKRIDHYVAAGQIQSTPLTENFNFVMVPILYAAVYQMVFRQDVAEHEIQKLKETHKQIMRLLLKAT